MTAAAVVTATLPLPSRAQIAHAFGRWHVSQWNTQQGLPTNVTTGLAYDRHDFLWVSTYSGLARFDGVEFQRFDPSTTPALPSTVTFVNADHNGELLVRSGHSLVRTQDETFVELGEWSNKVRSVHRGGAGTLLVQLSDSTTVLHDGDDRPMRRYRGAYTCGQDRKGRFWLVQGTTIRCMEGDREVARHAVTVDLVPHLITPWGDRGVLLHLTDRIGFVSPQAVELIPVERAIAPDLWRLQESPDPGWELNRILQAKDGAFWLATSRGLFRCESFPFSPDSCRESGARRILPLELSGPVEDLYEDDRGAVWAASGHGGLLRIMESLAQPLTTRPPWETLLPHLAWAHQTQWLRASAGDGTFWLRNLEGSVHARIDSADTVTASEDSSEALWLGWGLHVTKYQHGKAVRRLPTRSEVPRNIPLTEDDAGGLIWQLNYTIWRLHDGEVTVLAEQGREVLRKTPDGAVWYVNDAGLHRFKNGETRRFSEIPSRDPSFYRDVWTSPQGDLWVATRGRGLGVVSGGACRFAGFEEGVPDNTVGGIVPDDAGRLWINSNRGVFVVPTAALEDFARHESDWLPYRLVTHVESGTRKAARGEDGRLYFDSMDGIVSIDPACLSATPRPPQAEIVELRAGGRSIPRRDEVRLARGTRSLLVRYTAPDLHDGPEIRFRHRLDEHAEWKEVVRQREVLFSDLRPGNHRFEVQAAGVFGLWSEHRAPLSIVVLPYFYETRWFKVVVWMLAIGGLLLLYGMRSRARERQLAAVRAEVLRRQAAEHSLRLMGRRLISAQEDERRRIARELHDDISQRLALLSVELDMARPESFDRIRELANYCRDVSSDIRGMSHTLHPAKLEQLGLARSLESLCKEIGASTEIEVSFNAEGSSQPVSPEVTLCVYRIAQEALGNAVRHSGSEWATVELVSTPRQVCLTVADGGRGFEPAKRDDVGLGLTSMAERAKSLNGLFEIQSSPGGGTVVRATLPLADPT